MIGKISGCLITSALGDALGAPVEFLNIDQIEERFPPTGPSTPVGNPARVSDDTQMAMAVGEALLRAPRPYQPESLGAALIDAFIDWYHDPENNRAPGVTCLTSIERLIGGRRWQQATNINSKGCGANMRVQAVGLLPVDVATRAALAQFQGALTHGHPTALAASDLTAWVIDYLRADGNPETLIEQARVYAESQRCVYHHDCLGDLYTFATGYSGAEGFIARGWDECLIMLDRVANAMASGNYGEDPCLLVGAGWVAEEAFATALYCYLLIPNDPVAVTRRASATSGDSDSIACIAGAFAGASLGQWAMPPSWITRLEYRERLNAIAVGLAEMWEK